MTLSSGDKHVVDLFAVATAVGVWMGEILPTIVVLLTAIWTIIRIYETDTVQSLLRRKKKDGEST